MQNNGKKNIRHVVTALSLALSLPALHTPSLRAEIAIEQMSEAARIDEAIDLFYQFLDTSVKGVGFIKCMNQIIELLRGTMYDSLATRLENIVQCKSWDCKLTVFLGKHCFQEGEAKAICLQLRSIPVTEFPREILDALKAIDQSKGPGYIINNIVKMRLLEDRQ